MLKNFLKAFLPGPFVNWINARYGPLRMGGPFASWEAAAAQCRGYDQTNILETVRHAAQQVKQGKAAFERDGVAFAEPDYAWPLLTGLLYVAACDEGRLSVMDFGGSLGSAYLRHRVWLQGLREVRWHVVEQPHFVACGLAEFADTQLHFHRSVTDCIAMARPNVLLLGSVLQYLPRGLLELETLLALGIPTVIVDRTPFSVNDETQILVQTVSARIYRASYPCRFFGQSEFEALFVTYGYRKKATYLCPDRASIPSQFLGYIFEKFDVRGSGVE